MPIRGRSQVQLRPWLVVEARAVLGGTRPHGRGGHATRASCPDSAVETGSPCSARAAARRAISRAVEADAGEQGRKCRGSSARADLRRIGARNGHALVGKVVAGEASYATDSAVPASANRRASTAVPPTACMRAARRHSASARRAAVVAQVVELPQGVACGNGYSNEGCDATGLLDAHGQSADLVPVQRGGNRARVPLWYHASQVSNVRAAERTDDDWATQHRLDPNDPANGSQDANGDGYTNLEAFLNACSPWCRRKTACYSSARTFRGSRVTLESLTWKSLPSQPMS